MQEHKNYSDTFTQEQCNALDQIYQQLMYVFEHQNIRKNQRIMDNLNAMDNLRKIIAAKLSVIGSWQCHSPEDFKTKVFCQIIESINSHTSQLFDESVYDEIDKIIVIFESPLESICTNEISRFMHALDNDTTDMIQYLLVQTGIDINDEKNILKYFDEKAKVDVKRLMLKIEDEIHDMNIKYDNFITELIDTCTDQKLSDMEKIAEITEILSCRASKTASRCLKRKIDF